MDGWNHEWFYKKWIAKGWKERTTDRSVMFGNNLLIFFPL